MKYEHSLIIRLLFCFVPLSVFYFVLTPVTVYTSYFLLSFLNPVLISNTILVSGMAFEFVKACIAGSAYYLIWILIFLTKEIRFRLRLKLIWYGFLLVFIMNIIRIFILIFLAVKVDYFYFESVHLIFWKIVSGIYVAFVWIYLVKKFKIKSVPVYDDLKYLYNRSFFKTR